MDRKAIRSILMCLALSITFNISKEKIILELMDTLDTLYEEPSSSNKVIFMKHLFNIEMFEGGSIENHLNEFNIVTSLL